MVGYFDLGAWRSSPALTALKVEELGRSFGLNGDIVSGMGDDGRMDRVAIGGFPSPDGKGVELAMIVEGVWDQAAVTRSLLSEGAVEVAVGGASAFRMPKDENGDDFVLTFLDEGRLAVSEWGLAESVRAGGGPLSAPLAREVAQLPQGLSAWVLVTDPLKAGAASGVDTSVASGLAGGVRSLAVWARAQDALEIGASAMARDAQQATQLGAMLQLGMLGLAGQGGGEWNDVLSTVRFDTAGDRISLGFRLGPEHVAKLAKQFTSGPAAPAAAGADRR
jgi:hypothetical protein